MKAPASSSLHRFLVAGFTPAHDPDRSAVTIVRLIELAGLRIERHDPAAYLAPNWQRRRRDATQPVSGEK